MGAIVAGESVRAHGALLRSVVVHAGDEESPRPAGQLRFELVVDPLLQHRPGERGVDADPALPGLGLVGAEDAVARGPAAVGVLTFHVGARATRDAAPGPGRGR